MMLQNSKNYLGPRNKGKIVTHMAVWSLMSFIPYFFSSYFMIEVSFNFYILFVFIHLTVFYINYYVLIPSLLFKKKWEQYLFSSVILFAIIFFITDLIINDLFSIQIADKDNFQIHTMQNVSGFTDAGFHPLDLPDNIKFVFLTNSLMFFYIAGLSLRFVQKWRQDESYKTQLENEKISTELSLLKQQINPHFLFNTLNNIYSLSISKSQAVPESILRLASILRYTLYESEDKISNSNDELKIIDDYIQLQKLRLTDKVSVNYKLISEPVEYRIEPLIIVTLLENAFKYGVDTNSNSFIDIILVILNGKLLLRVKNKIVRQAPADNKSSGIGLKNIQRRLDLIYPNRYLYNVSIKNMEYSVFLKIEL